MPATAAAEPSRTPAKHSFDMHRVTRCFSGAWNHTISLFSVGLCASARGAGQGRLKDEQSSPRGSTRGLFFSRSRASSKSEAKEGAADVFRSESVDATASAMIQATFRGAKGREEVASTRQSSNKDGTATPATAAPEEDALLERPSLSRADLLGGKPGHFARTHVKKVVADAAKPNVTIVVDGAGGDVVADSSLVKIKRKGLRPGLGRQGSLGARGAPRSARAPPAAEVEGEASPASVTEDVAAKTEREKELEARLAVLEEQLSKTQCR